LKKFSFSLSKILDFKDQTLSIKQNELALLMEKLRTIEKQIDDLKLELTLNNNQMVEKMAEGINQNEILIYKTYFSVLNIKIQNLLRNKATLAQSISRKKEEIIAINTEISGLEKLRDKQFEEYMKSVQKLEEQNIESFIQQTQATAS